MKQIVEYMRYRKLPATTQTRIRDYYGHKYQGKMFNEDAILSELSDCLKLVCTQVVTIMHTLN